MYVPYAFLQYCIHEKLVFSSVLLLRGSPVFIETTDIHTRRAPERWFGGLEMIQLEQLFYNFMLANI